jgi:hypothetical protein
MKHLLLNLAAMHSTCPGCIPTKDIRETLEVGEVAKMIFLNDEHKTEAMWVEVLAHHEGGYSGKLANDPSLMTHLKIGDLVDFGPEHIGNVGKRQPFAGSTQNDEVKPARLVGMNPVLAAMYGQRQPVAVIPVGQDGTKLTLYSGVAPEVGEPAIDKSKLH